MRINLDEVTPANIYFLMTQTIIPRPIAWVLTENSDASHNLAPFSYFNAVSSKPPLIMLSIGRQNNNDDKDTLRNIKNKQEFIVHIASKSDLASLNKTSATLPPNVSEVEMNSLSLSPFEGARLPRLTQCKVALSCVLYSTQTIDESGQCLVLGQVKDIYIDDDCVEISETGRTVIDAEKIDPLSRLGAAQYASMGDVLSVKRSQ
jgi:flavin reductase (DIM6/NTAB) family NADH-FMN oxidoreductase RutF